MKKTLSTTYQLLLLATVLIATAATAMPSHSMQLITANTLGPISIGMTVKEAEKVTGKQIIKQALIPNVVTEDCRYATFKGAPYKVLFMLNHNRIVRIDIKNSLFKTRAGIHVGSTVNQVLIAYQQQIKVEPDKYAGDKGWQNLIIMPHNNQPYRLIFDTDGKKVINIRLGKTPEVEYVEGCA